MLSIFFQYFIHHKMEVQQTKMINFDDITNENNEKHNLKWPYDSDHLYKMLIIGGSGSGKTNTLLHLINKQDSDSNVDKIYL